MMNGSSSRYCRRGSVYVLVLGATMLVMTIGLTALYAARVESRSSTTSNDLVASRLYAQSAIEMGMFLILDDPNWRDNRTSGWWEVDTAIGDGTYSLQVTDPVDGILSNTQIDQIVMLGVGMKGDARHILSVILNPSVPNTTPALDALRTGIHSALDFGVYPGATLTVSGAPASSNAQMVILGMLDGDFEAASSTITGTHIGIATVPAPAKELPSDTLFAQYVARATQIPYSGPISRNVLAPGYNDYGGNADPNGVYYIDTGGSALLIEGSRINGTLIVETRGADVELKSELLLHKNVATYPVLIVNGNLTFDFTGSANGLKEAIWGVNFNPDGARYLGSGDPDQLDDFPSGIEGLVHCTGSFVVKNTPATMRGAIICELNVSITSDLSIVHDPDLLTDPPLGYTEAPVSAVEMKIVRGSWRQVVD